MDVCYLDALEFSWKVLYLSSIISGWTYLCTKYTKRLCVYLIYVYVCVNIYNTCIYASQSHKPVVASWRLAPLQSITFMHETALPCIRHHVIPADFMPLCLQVELCHLYPSTAFPTQCQLWFDHFHTYHTSVWALLRSPRTPRPSSSLPLHPPLQDRLSCCLALVLLLSLRFRSLV